MIIAPSFMAKRKNWQKWGLRWAIRLLKKLLIFCGPLSVIKVIWVLRAWIIGILSFRQIVPTAGVMSSPYYSLLMRSQNHLNRLKKRNKIILQELYKRLLLPKPSESSHQFDRYQCRFCSSSRTSWVSKLNSISICKVWWKAIGRCHSRWVRTLKRRLVKQKG